MSQVTITCPECGWETEAEESLIGRRVKCPKCKESFVAEKAGLYELVEPPPRPKAADPSPPLEPQGTPSKRSKRGMPQPRPKADSVDPDFLANLEKWAEE